MSSEGRRESELGVNDENELCFRRLLMYSKLKQLDGLFLYMNLQMSIILFGDDENEIRCVL